MFGSIKFIQPKTILKEKFTNISSKVYFTKCEIKYDIFLKYDFEFAENISKDNQSRKITKLEQND